MNRRYINFGKTTDLGRVIIFQSYFLEVKNVSGGPLKFFVAEAKAGPFRNQFGEMRKCQNSFDSIQTFLLSTFPN